MQLWTLQLKTKFSLFLGILILIPILSRCSLLGSSGLRHAKNLSFSTPSGWTETQPEGDTDKAFKLPSGSTVTVTSSCQETRNVSLRNLTKDLLLGARKVKFLNQETMIIARTEALFSQVNATVEGQAFQLLFVVLKKHGCVFDLSLVSTKSISRDEIKEFISFSKSFEYEQS